MCLAPAWRPPAASWTRTAPACTSQRCPARLALAVQEAEEEAAPLRVTSATSFSLRGRALAMGDCVLVEPATFDQLPGAAEARVLLWNLSAHAS